MAEPALDLSEIIDLYKEDARRMVKEMRQALEHWDDLAAGGTAQKTFRRLSHQMRGSGRTYGFRDVTRICKAMENIVLKLEKNLIQPDVTVRHILQRDVDRLTVIFGA